MNIVNLNCKECGISITRNESEYNYAKNKGKVDFFCSISCGTKHQRKREERQKQFDYLQTPRLCQECQTPLPYTERHKKFCNSKCNYQHSVKSGYLKMNTKHGKYKIKLCKVCNTPTKNTCCSIKCRTEYLRQKRINKLKNNQFSSSNATLRKSLKELKGEICERCHLSEWFGMKIPLTVHHIDGNSSNNTNENLQLLCWNCHAQTDNFASKNKNSNRSYRRKFYKNHGYC